MFIYQRVFGACTIDPRNSGPALRRKKAAARTLPKDRHTISRFCPEKRGGHCMFYRASQTRHRDAHL